VGNFIKVNRGMVDSDIWFANSKYLKIWLYILFQAGWDDSGKYQKGKFYINWGRALASCELGSDISMDTVKKCLRYLKDKGMITSERSTRGSWITVTNYSKYQDVTQSTGTTEAPVVAPGKHLPTTNGGTQGGTPIYKEIKNKRNKEIKNINISPAAKKSKSPTDGSRVWISYAKAYESRYLNIPVRNAKTNSICSKLVSYVGVEDAISIVEQFLRIDDSFYIRKAHDLGLCLSDYQKILTTAKTGVSITETNSRQIDKQRNNINVVNSYLGRDEKCLKW